MLFRHGVIVLISRSKNRGNKTRENHPFSFRFGAETKRRLGVVCTYANKKKTVVLEELIDRAYEALAKGAPDELQRIERKDGPKRKRS